MENEHQYDNRHYCYISGMQMIPCHTSEDEYGEMAFSTQYSTKSQFKALYENHIIGMQVIVMCAKSFIVKNWHKVLDWSDLDVVIEDNSEKLTDYYNFLSEKKIEQRKKHEERNKGNIHGRTLNLDKKNSLRHNPIKTVSEIILDPSDGDLSIMINGKWHNWIYPDSVILIANYIEEQIKLQS